MAMANRLGIVTLCSPHNVTHFTSIIFSARARHNEIAFNHSMVLGALTSVRSPNLTVQGSTISVTWEPPNIISVDPDIEGYYVNIAKLCSSSSLQTLGTEFVTETEYSYPTPPDGACCIYMFAITPVNEAGNGKQSTKSYIRTETRMLFSVSL